MFGSRFGWAGKVDWPSILSNVGQVAGSIAKGSSEGRQVESNELLRRDDTLLRAAEAAADNELKQKEWSLMAPKERMRQTILGDLLSRVQDTRFNRPSTIPGGGRTGGIRPSALGPNARLAGKTLSDQTLKALQAGDQFKGFSFDPATLPEAGLWEKLMGGVGQGAGLLSAILRARGAADPAAPGQVDPTAPRVGQVY
jgi:hypothetical protein